MSRPSSDPEPDPEPGHPRPLVFAHRGASAALPEHTVTAYLRAIEEGADGVECDVRLTADGHLVCVHDRRLDRVSNGRGPVSARALAELDELDFGSWHPGLPDTADDLILERDRPPERVLTLDTLLEVVRDAHRPVRLLVETKHPTRYGQRVEEALAATLHRFGMAEPDERGVQVSIMSFSAGAIKTARQLLPGLPTVLLLEFLPPWLRDGRLPAGCHVAGPAVRLLRAHPEIVQRLHERGNQVYVWTVNARTDLDLVDSTGVDGIITDLPREIIDWLDRTSDGTAADRADSWAWRDRPTS